jgi:hypothetical protein
MFGWFRRRPKNGFRWVFKVLRDCDGRFHLLGRSPDHVTMMHKVNSWVGSPVLELCGSGIGVNLKVIDDDAWSDYVSAHVDDDQTDKTLGKLEFAFVMPDGPPRKREV